MCIVGYVVYLDLDLDGERILSHSVSSEHVMVTGPDPELRVLTTKGFVGDQFWQVIIDPVYIHSFIPRQYDTVEVVLTYRADTVPLIQLGGAVGESGWNFAWHGVQNKALEEIEWPCLRDEEKQWWLCQRVPQYRSIENFLLAPPRSARVVNYNFPLQEGFDRLRIDGYNHETDLDNYDYFIAQYIPPSTSGDWNIARAEFVFSELYQSPEGFEFVISAPGIDDRSQTVDVKSIDIIYKKDPMTINDVWQRVLEKF